MRFGAALAAFLCALSLQAAAIEIGGAQFPSSASVGGQTLILNGAGVREKFVFKAYAIGLYLSRRADSLDAIRALDGASRIELVTLRNLTADQLCDALNEFIVRNHDAAELANLKSRVEALDNIMKGIGKASENTRIQLDYIPEKGTRVTVNGQVAGADIPGADFRLALLKVWLGREVPQESLRLALLGKK